MAIRPAVRSCLCAAHRASELGAARSGRRSGFRSHPPAAPSILRTALSDGCNYVRFCARPTVDFSKMQGLLNPKNTGNSATKPEEKHAADGKRHLVAAAGSFLAAKDFTMVLAILKLLGSNFIEEAKKRGAPKRLENQDRDLQFLEIVRALELNPQCSVPAACAAAANQPVCKKWGLSAATLKSRWDQFAKEMGSTGAKLAKKVQAQAAEKNLD